MTDDQTRPIETSVPADPEAAAGSTEASVGAPTAAPQASAAAAAGTVPVAPASPGSNRARWIIGLGVAGIAIVAAVGAMLLLSRPTTPEALRYIPGDAPFVAEVRLDLPGDQTQHLGNLLAHFPGFADQSTLTDKIDEALSQFVEMAGGVDADYRTDIKPWLNGALFVGVLTPPGGVDTAGPESIIVSATTNGAVDCAATFEGQTVTHETYRGLDLVISPDSQVACVLDGRQALIGDPATVRKALDAKADGSGMNQRAEYGAARTALGGDRLATMYVNGAALQALIPNPGELGGEMPALPAFMTPSFPAWIMAGVRAEDDALVIDTVTGPIPAPSAGPSMLPMPAGHASLIAPMLPADTLAYVEIQGAGVGLQNLLTQLREVPELAQPLAMLDGLGGGSGLVSWIDDVGIGVSVQGTTPETLVPEVALVLIARDEATASATVSSLDTMLGLAGLGGGLEVSEETINGVQVTTVTITDLGALIPPGSVPGVEVPPMEGPVSFSIAARGRAVILTFGDGAMADVVNAGAGTSLADNAAFKRAAARGVANSQATMYVAAGATFDLVRGFLPPAELAQFNTEVAPYLDPLDAVFITGSSDATGARSRIVISVATP